MTNSHLYSLLVLLGGSLLATPAVAQTGFPDEAARVRAIEADVDRIATEPDVLAYARELAAANDLSGAASTLEAFLIANENSEAVRAEYAVTLCRLDDIEAGKFEGAKLVSMNASAQTMNAVTAACGQLPDLTNLALSGE